MATHVLGAGSHTIRFQGMATPHDDATAYIDDVRLTTAGAGGSLVASDNGSGVTLTASDGANIRLNFSSGSPQSLGLGGIAYGVGSDGITYSHLELSSSAAAGLTLTGSKVAALGLAGAPVLNAGGSLAGLDIATVAGANKALDTLDASIAMVDSQSAVLGAVENRLGRAIENVRDAQFNVSAARSRIVDLDYAEGMSHLVRAQVLQQAGLAMLAQANLRKSDVLRLLNL